MESLAEIFKRHCVTKPGDHGHGDKGSTHSYIDVYEELLKPYRSGCDFMEIGLALGLSLAMWREYMPNATLYGVDLNIVFDPAPHLNGGKTMIIQADATKPAFLERVKGYRFDVVIDDASHLSQDQVATFKLISPLIKPGGIYCIEDVLNLEMSGQELTRLHQPCQVFDLRKKKGCYSDVLIVYRF